jgi:hypothetical protein
VLQEKIELLEKEKVQEEEKQSYEDYYISNADLSQES